MISLRRAVAAHLEMILLDAYDRHGRQQRYLALCEEFGRNEVDEMLEWLRNEMRQVLILAMA